MVASSAFAAMYAAFYLVWIHRHRKVSEDPCGLQGQVPNELKACSGHRTPTRGSYAPLQLELRVRNMENLVILSRGTKHDTGRMP